MFYPNSVWLPILMPTLIVFLIGLLGSANVRVAFVAIGGFFILSSSSKLDAPKLLYLAGYALAFGIALVHCIKIERENRSLVAITVALFALITFSLPVALVSGNSPVNWARDAASLGLVAAVPIFALNVRGVRSRLPLIIAFLLTGLIGAFVFSAHNLKGRMAPTQSLPSFFLPGSLFIYAAAEVIVGRSLRAGWALVAAVVMTFILFSGSRGALVLLAIPPAMTIVGVRPSWRTLVKYSLESIALGALALALFLNYSSSFDKLLGLSAKQTLNHLLLIETLAKTPSKDSSFQERLWETIVGTEAFLAHPITGVGPGHLFTFKRATGNSETTFAMVDTPMEFPAKYGLIGVGVLLLSFYFFYRFLRGRLREEIEPSMLALIGFALFTLLRIIISPPFDDKGYSMGLLFLLCLCIIDESARTENVASAIGSG